MVAVTLVTPYNPDWPAQFDALAARYRSALADLPHKIEHVGSTSVPGMTAKPVIDVDIVIARADFAGVRGRLAGLGYWHQGDKGLPDREAFDLSEPQLKRSLPAHHLYVCIAGTPELAKHIVFRDFMRRHPEWVQRLSAHKVELCLRHANDRQSYIDGKAAMVQQITALAMSELCPRP